MLEKWQKIEILEEEYSGIGLKIREYHYGYSYNTSYGNSYRFFLSLEEIDILLSGNKYGITILPEETDYDI
jgi:hypothetical protein|tara:strand:+ start:349 stop:561 length:213 start_codon:yes stop_codon:yes gene_type:complete